MRVALVSDWAPPRLGGIERQIADLAVQLRAHGHDARIITVTPGPALMDGIPVHRIASCVPPGWRGLQRLVAPLGLAIFDPVPRGVSARLGELFARHRIDVVHGHSLWSTLALMATKLAREQGRASVLTNHSLLERGGIVFFRGASGMSPWNEWPHMMTAVSDAAARDASLASRRAVRVIPNGLDTMAWAGARTVPRARPSSRRMRIVSVMRLNSRKSPHLLIDSFAFVRAQLDGAAPRLDVYGDGPLRPALERKIASLALTDLVTLHGAVASDKIACALATADVFALPGRREAFGIAAAEALAAGVPVVAMRGRTADVVLKEGVGGLLAADANDLARQIIRLVTDDDLRARLASAAPAHAARFDWQRVAPLYLAAYRDALAAT